MIKNMGTADRAIRLVLALLVGGLYFSGSISGTVAIVLLVIAVVFLVTSLTARCPAYVPFGISTRQRAAGGTQGGAGTA